jgi:hypothetical protein
MAQMKKEAEMKQHGNAAMGFDQDRSTHHFLMTSDGGSIAVDANDPADQLASHRSEVIFTRLPSPLSRATSANLARRTASIRPALR